VTIAGPRRLGACRCSGRSKSAVTTFEVITLIQTGKLDRFPIVVMGGDFWDHMRDFIRRTMIEGGTIDESDLTLIRPARTPEEALRLVREGHRSQEVPR
jgi:predicted Rossmann-fold nucleotide-binding protein